MDQGSIFPNMVSRLLPPSPTLDIGCPRPSPGHNTMAIGPPLPLVGSPPRSFPLPSRWSSVAAELHSTNPAVVANLQSLPAI